MTKTDLDQREKDIQTVCRGVIDSGIDSTGDYGPGGQCPYCFTPCSWNDSMDDFKHKDDCIYVIAKDLMTGYQL